MVPRGDERAFSKCCVMKSRIIASGTFRWNLSSIRRPDPVRTTTRHELPHLVVTHGYILQNITKSHEFGTKSFDQEVVQIHLTHQSRLSTRDLDRRRPTEIPNQGQHLL